MDSKIVKDEADNAILAGDHWLRQNGIVSDFQLNTIVAYIHLNFPQTVNVSLDLDKSNQRIFVKIQLKFWTIVGLMLRGRRQAMLDDIFVWLCEYLPTYQVSVDMLRAKSKSQTNITPRSLNPDLKPGDLDTHSSLAGE